jgi:hypothetical protein
MTETARGIGQVLCLEYGAAYLPVPLYDSYD